MGLQRWPIPAAILGIFLMLSIALRDVVYRAVVLPVAYVLWFAGLYYAAVPQLVTWLLLATGLCLALAWNLIPDWRASPRKGGQYGRVEGKVEALARWIHRARQSNYFKWQLANRLARVSRSLEESSRGKDDSRLRDEAVDRYLTAGISNSFVDFPGPSNRFGSYEPTPLDIDPTQVVEYLESEMEMSRAGRPGSH